MGPVLRRREVTTTSSDVTPQQVSRLVELAAALADRMEARPAPADPDLHQQRQEKVQVLRDTVAAGRSALRRTGVPSPSAAT